MKVYALLIVISVLPLAQAVGQTFEGKIVYENNYKSKMPGVADEQFDSMMGTSQEYFIKGGNYKSVMSGEMFQWQLYRHLDNKLYMKMSTSPAVLWKDGSENPDQVEKVEINKGVTTILGHRCHELILTCKSGVQKYYFSPDLKVDADLFKDHKFGNFDKFISTARALPLKVVMETPQFTMESVATEIVPQKLQESAFELPENAQLQKSPY